MTEVIAQEVRFLSPRDGGASSDFTPPPYTDEGGDIDPDDVPF